MLKNRIIYLLVMMGLYLFYLFCDSYVAVFIICLLLIMTLISGLMSFAVSRKLNVRISRSATKVDLDERTIEFCVVTENRTCFPAAVMIVDLMLKDMAEQGVIKRRIKTTLGSFDSKKVYITVSAPYASVVEADALKAKVCDSFGVFSFSSKRKNEPYRVLISPVSKGRHDSEDVVLNKITDSDIYSDTQKGDDRSQVFELRNYREGDDLRNVHWPLSSRRDMLIVKEFSLPIEDSCVVLLESALGTENIIPPLNITEKHGISRLFERIKKKKAVKRDIVLEKQRADRLLGEFTRLASDLLSEGHIFTVCFYSSKSKHVVIFEVRSYEDVAVVLKGYLSEELPTGEMLSFKAYFSLGSHSETLYYIFDSSVEGAVKPADSDGIAFIDVFDQTESIVTGE